MTEDFSDGLEETVPEAVEAWFDTAVDSDTTDSVTILESAVAAELLDGSSETLV